MRGLVPRCRTGIKSKKWWGAMADNRFDYTFKSDMTAVKPVISEIMRFIKSRIPDISEAHEFELKLVFSELLFNSVIHGNRLDIGRKVDIAVEVNRNLISATVSDEGSGYDYASLINKINVDDNLTEENGRGLKLVSVLTDKIEFNLAGSSIKFCKRVFHNG
jgi:anti-sigma regulatory factor (Ser/Thr protein kinase)